MRIAAWANVLIPSLILLPPLVPARSVGSSRKEKTPVAPYQLLFDDPVARETNLRETMEHAIDRLAHQLAEGHTAGFKEILRFYSRFWT